MWKIYESWKHLKSYLNAESTAATDNFMINWLSLQILQYNIRKSLKIQESFLINKEVREFNIVII